MDGGGPKWATKEVICLMYTTSISGQVEGSKGWRVEGVHACFLCFPLPGRRDDLIMVHTHLPKCVVSLVGSVEDVGTCLRMGGEMKARLVQGSQSLFLGLG